MPTDSKQPSKPQPRTHPKSETSDHAPEESSGKIFAPDSPVDVPNFPKLNTEHDQTPDKAPLKQFEREADAQARNESSDQDGKPRKIDPSKSSWADSTQPAPDKKNARTSIL